MPLLACSYPVFVCRQQIEKAMSEFPQFPSTLAVRRFQMLAINLLTHLLSALPGCHRNQKSFPSNDWRGSPAIIVTFMTSKVLINVVAKTRNEQNDCGTSGTVTEPTERHVRMRRWVCACFFANGKQSSCASCQCSSRNRRFG